VKTEHQKMVQQRLSKEGLMQSNANVVEMFIQDKPEEHKKEEPVQ